MKIVIPGGSGQVGQILVRAFDSLGHQTVVLSRAHNGSQKSVPWDGKNLGPWTEELDGADAVINLAGRSVNCRYTKPNLKAMMDSRVDSTKVVGQAIAMAKRPPKIWLQMSTATLYAHRFEAPNDEESGLIGGNEKDAPDYWSYSVEIAKAWEKSQYEADTPHTRKVALRTAMVMSSDRGGVFCTLSSLARRGLGGSIAGGKQYVSWIHEKDFAAAVQFLIDQDHIEGPVNLSSPNPLPQRDFMKHLREQAGIRWGLPATAWMAKIGALFMRTDTELVLKSRRVIPARLRSEGFRFEYSQWPLACEDLVKRWDCR